MWLVFAVTAASLFAADIKLSAGRAHEIGRREAFMLCGFWVIVACIFGFLTGYMLGYERMIEYFTGYVIEYSLRGRIDGRRKSRAACLKGRRGTLRGWQLLCR